MNKLNVITYLLGFTLFFVACTEDTQETPKPPTEMDADNKWVEGNIGSEAEIWYKVKCDPGSTTAYVEWAENGAHGEDRNYTGDIKVSAYQLDGVTAYFENKDKGYGDKAKSCALENNETDILVKVELGETQTPGTYALRSKATSVVEVEYANLAIQDAWRDSTINENEIIGFKVEYNGQRKLKIVWAEIETPEQGYTADVMVSVLKKDGTTPYKDVDKNKDMLDKNKSHSNDPKFIITDPTEKNLKIHVKNTTPGSFAIKVVDVTE